ncbi:MAG: hypothetical protein KDA91_06015 [Planctomycetaceae bacterium]|nr:hypothetical protein [Planctomycetaceae bacterium]
MSIEELLEQMEQYRLRREQQDYRPDWLKQFIRKAACLFEPLADFGRVGYDCRVDERGWILCMYLGATETIGGPLDGHIDHAGFRMDLKHLQSLFVRIDRMEWYSVANKDSRTPEQSIRSLLSVHGVVGEANEIKLELMAVPPDFVGPGLHCRPNGMIFET